MQIPTVWAKKLMKLDAIKNLQFKKGNRDEWSVIVWGKMNTIKRRSKGTKARMGISYPMHTTDISIYFDFMQLLTKLTDNEL